MLPSSHIPFHVCRIAAFMATLAALPVSDAAAADDAVAMVVDLVTRDDAEFRAIGLERIRDGVKGEAATRAFTALLDKQPAARQVELVRSLADRGDAAALPALTALLERSQDPTVRTAAVAALGALGGGDEVTVLVKSLAAGDPERAAAQRALLTIRSDAALEKIVATAKSGTPADRTVMINILGERLVKSALPDLAALSTDADSTVREAAIKVLGRIGGAAEVPALVAALLAASQDGERKEAERAVLTVCTKNPGHEDAARTFLEVFKGKPETDQETLLPTLGGIGGPDALAIIDALIASAEADKWAFGLKAISRWPDATVAPRLLKLVGKASNPDERELLLGALIRIAPLPDNKLDNAQKLDLVKQTMALCTADADRARLLERASAIRTVETLRFVVPYLDQPALAAPACTSVVELAHHQKLRSAHKAYFLAALDKVLATTKDAELIERATRYKEGKTWERKR